MRKALLKSQYQRLYLKAKNGVCIEAEVPKDWGLTRIFQFMESLMKSELV